MELGKLKSLFKSTTFSSNTHEQSVRIVAPAKTPAWPGGATNEEEAGFILHLNAITQEALPDLEWHRFGPVWRAYYHLVHREGQTPQEQWKYGGLTDDAFERLARGMKLPERKTVNEIIASGPECLTLFLTENLVLDEASQKRVVVPNQRHALLDPGSPLVDTAGCAAKSHQEGMIFRHGNLPWLQQNWEQLRDAVNAEYGLAAPALQQAEESMTAATTPAPA